MCSNYLKIIAKIVGTVVAKIYGYVEPINLLLVKRIASDEHLTLWFKKEYLNHNIQILKLLLEKICSPAVSVLCFLSHVKQLFSLLYDPSTLSAVCLSVISWTKVSLSGYIFLQK